MMNGESSNTIKLPDKITNNFFFFFFVTTSLSTCSLLFLLLLFFCSTISCLTNFKRLSPLSTSVLYGQKSDVSKEKSLLWLIQCLRCQFALLKISSRK
ncbi:hypothetical protein BD408DRAFT_205058 [Parasitella parasitica]|nr:hypothetical protein BD408DRAFT_205058 [Parasitella parasitica]